MRLMVVTKFSANLIPMLKAAVSIVSEEASAHHSGIK